MLLYSTATIQTFSISLASGFVLFVVQFGLFLTFRNYLWAKRIYQPRSFLHTSAFQSISHPSRLANSKALQVFIPAELMHQSA